MESYIFIKHLENSGILKPRFEEDGVTPTESYLAEEKKAVKLLEAFDTISDFTNNYNANPQVFQEAIICGIGHRTLQQTFNSMIFKYITYLASDEYRQKRTDARNEGSHVVAKQLVDSFKEEQGYDFTGHLSCV